MKNLKRKAALALTLCLIMSIFLCIPANAAESSTKLTTTVPECTYTFSIPADTNIAYNETESTIGTVSVSNVQHLGSRVIRVEILSGYALISTTNSGDSIGYTLFGTNEAVSGNGYTETTEWEVGGITPTREIVADRDHWLRTVTVKARISEDAWKNANPGTYEGTISFSFSICDN